ncbi:MAG TPA: GNAT family N-acetyltransferase [Propionibacteriaceae bacterium]
MQNVARLTLRQARASDLGEVLDVLDEAASWLSGLGLTQWPRRFESAWVLPPMEAGKTWLADIEGIPAATITLDWSDHIWPDDQRAGYVHRMAVRRSAAGLGMELLEWAQQECLRHRRRLLRLDCVADNLRLLRYYETASFVHCGDARVGRPPGQRSLGAATRTVVSRYQRLIV